MHRQAGLRRSSRQQARISTLSIAWTIPPAAASMENQGEARANEWRLTRPTRYGYLSKKGELIASDHDVAESDRSCTRRLHVTWICSGVRMKTPRSLEHERASLRSSGPDVCCVLLPNAKRFGPTDEVSRSSAFLAVCPSTWREVSNPRSCATAHEATSLEATTSGCTAAFAKYASIISGHRSL